MKFFVAVFVTISCYLNGALAMDCNFGTSKNFLDKVIHTCPRPIIDTSDEEYCCLRSDGDVECCNLYQFVGASIIFFLPYIIGFLILSCICSCICCLCCRRSGGRVYRTGPPLGTVTSERIIIVPSTTMHHAVSPVAYNSSVPLMK
ncbi:uncharacterized protein LOC142322170 [Lycorma delicatula]|uniref:uncharacterized protein LOC142322170 n=1 Tax=Lycorma delicatula TaxID=130591 RepID=UPI003F5127F3